MTTAETATYSLSHIRYLEAESIHVHAGGGRGVRAAGAPVLDRQGLVRACCAWRRRRFSPGRSRSRSCTWTRATSSRRCTSSATATCARSGPTLLVWRNEPAIASGANPFDLGHAEMLRVPQDGGAPDRAPPPPLRRGHRRAPGATRRSRAPRSASSPSATSSASGTRRTSGPSCGTSTTLASTPGESIRVFPLSNWTELDVWQYIYAREDPRQSRSTSPGSARRWSATARSSSWTGLRAAASATGPAPGEQVERDPLPVPQPRLRALFRRGALDGRDRRGDRRGDDGRAHLRARHARHRPRRRRSMEKKKREGYF